MFAFTSLLCGLAPTLPLLILARVAQGVAGGFALPLGSARLFSAFPPEKRGVAFGVFGIVLVCAPMIGPMIGGALIDANLRSWIFFINVPIGVLGVLVGSRLLADDDPNRRSTARLGWRAVTLTCLAFGGVLLGASLLGSPGGAVTARYSLIAFVVGGAALVALVVTELRRETPLLNLRLYRTRTYTSGTLINCFGQISVFGLQFLLPLAMQVVGGASALDAGLAFIPLAATSAVSGIVAGKIRDRIGARAPLTVALVVLAVGIMLILSRLSDPTPENLLVPLLLTGFGAGAIPPTTQVATLNDIRRQDINSGTSLLQAVQRVSQSLGVAVLATIVSRSVGAASAGQRSEYLAGLHVAFTVSLTVALCCAVVAVTLPGWPGKGGVRGRG
jgi:EmrB/QacA subfamily drug resistance transporter